MVEGQRDEIIENEKMALQRRHREAEEIAEHAGLNTCVMLYMYVFLSV
jgi:hypothetical protein